MHYLNNLVFCCLFTSWSLTPQHLPEWGGIKLWMEIPIPAYLCYWKPFLLLCFPFPVPHTSSYTFLKLPSTHATPFLYIGGVGAFLRWLSSFELRWWRGALTNKRVRGSRPSWALRQMQSAVELLLQDVCLFKWGSFGHRTSQITPAVVPKNRFMSGPLFAPEYSQGGIWLGRLQCYNCKQKVAGLNPRTDRVIFCWALEGGPSCPQLLQGLAQPAISENKKSTPIWIKQPANKLNVTQLYILVKPYRYLKGRGEPIALLELILTFWSTFQLSAGLPDQNASQSWLQAEV